MTDKPLPRCPYCGAEMELCTFCPQAAYLCPDCKSRAPMIDMDWQAKASNANNWSRIDRLAQKAALRRPLQKPLTFEEVLRLPDDGGNYPLHILFRDGVTTWALKYSLLRNIDLTDPDTVERIRGIYGHDYLLYRGEITDSERAAAQWEE